MKLMYQGNTPLDDWHHKRQQRREMLRQGAIEFLACAAIFFLLALFTVVMFLF